MTLEYLSLDQIVPSTANPRKAFDASGLEGLADSIRTDGLLQNLVVRPSRGKRFAIVSGERRFRALKMLQERGELPEGFLIPAEIRCNLTAEERLRLSTVENLQRADLTPLEQAAALARLIGSGTRLENIAAQTGLSPNTIRRRLILKSLCKEAKAALESKSISLAQAEALTLGSIEEQRRIVQSLRSGTDDSAATIKSRLIGKRPAVADALFPLERYTGTLTTDLFAEEETSYFDDPEQFLALQKEAVQELADRCRATALWVEVTDEWTIPAWKYKEAQEGEVGGVLINLSPRGLVDLREGLLRPEADIEDDGDGAAHPAAPRKEKASVTVPLCRIVAHEKTAAIGELLLASPRAAKEVLAVMLLRSFKPHEAYREASRRTEWQTPFNVLHRQGRAMAQKLGLLLGDTECGWDALQNIGNPVLMLEAVKRLSCHDLESLYLLLVALTFGQENCGVLDSGGSLFNRVAADLKADMRNHWKPDRAFLSRRTRKQLVDIACACGYAHGRSVSALKKKDLIAGILFHDAQARMAASPNQAQRQALSWLPDLMRFPAIDPDAPTTEDGETVEDADCPAKGSEEDANLCEAA